MNTIKIIISTQVLEWYGDEDHIGEEGHGRYKTKGGEDFIMEVDEASFWYHENDIRVAFSKKYDMNGMFYRHQVLGMDIYREPLLVDGTFDPEKGELV